jgi:hypothetical protein
MTVRYTHVYDASTDKKTHIRNKEQACIIPVMRTRVSLPDKSVTCCNPNKKKVIKKVENA